MVATTWFLVPPGVTRVHNRLLPTGLAHLSDQSTPSPLGTAATAYQKAIDNLTNATGLAV